MAVTKQVATVSISEAATYASIEQGVSAIDAPLPAAKPFYDEIGGLTSAILLILTTVCVDGTIPWLQGLVARNANFDPSAMVLAETSCYVFGGLIISFMMHGMDGIWRCLAPRKYLLFLPASLAFSACNVLTYIAVKGLGASQFVLLVQLRVVVVALLGAFWLKQNRTAIEWLTLVQLTIGMLVLVDLEAIVGHHEEMTSGMSEGARNHAWYVSVAALIGVIFLCGFAYVYMESQLKATAEEPLYIQQHQLSFFGCVTAMWLCLRNNFSADAESMETIVEGVGHIDHISMPVVFLLFLIIARGVLTSFLLKKLDSVIKGLVDVASIVYCSGLQIVVDGVSMDFMTAGLQSVVLLSIMQYFMLRGKPPAAEGERMALRLPPKV